MSQSTRIKALLNKVFAGKLPTQKLHELLPSKNVQSQHPTLALAEFDAYTRFKAMAATGNSEEGLKILAKLDTLFIDQNQ